MLTFPQMMLGPTDFGSTASVNGIWQILHRLHILMDWGQTEYAKWFQDHVMKWAREVAAKVVH